MTVSAIAQLAPLPQASARDAKQMASAAPVATNVQQLPFYATPVYKVDSLTNIPIELTRDPTTGAVINQYPSAQVVEKYRLHELPLRAAPANAPAVANSQPGGAGKSPVGAGVTGLAVVAGGRGGSGGAASAGPAVSGASITV